MAERRNGYWLVWVRLWWNNSDLFYLWELGYQAREESGGSTLRDKLGARVFWLWLCMAPLWIKGIRGKKSTPSVGWEVSVKYSWLEGGDLDIAQAREMTIDFSPSVTVFSFWICIISSCYCVYVFRISRVAFESFLCNLYPFDPLRFINIFILKPFRPTSFIWIFLCD
jgi:hypothetical protein